MDDLASYRALANKLVPELAHATAQVRVEKRRLIAAMQRLEDCETAQQIIQEVAATVQEVAHKRIADVVSKCLAAVYEDPYEFRIVFERKRGKTEARLVFVRDGHELHPTTESGIGQVDVAAFALRIACMALRTPSPRRVLVADEPFKNVNGEGNRERAAQLLEVLARDFDLQIILVTGYDWLQVGKVIRIGE